MASVNPRAAAIVAERPRGRRTRGVRSRCVGVQRRRKCSTTEISARNGKKDSIIHNELCAGQEWVVCQAMARLERTWRIQKVEVSDRSIVCVSRPRILQIISANVWSVDMVYDYLFCWLCFSVYACTVQWYKHLRYLTFWLTRPPPILRMMIYWLIELYLKCFYNLYMFWWPRFIFLLILRTYICMQL